MFFRRTPGLVVLALGLGCVGCRQTHSDVYVDLSQVPLFQTNTPVAPKVGLVALAPRQNEFTLPALPPIAESRSSANGAAKVQASIAANRERTYAVILKRLKDTFTREAEALRDKRVADFEPKRRTIIATAMDKISDAYRTYANQVGPKIARLAVTAGFPDPDPHGRRNPSGLEGLDKYAFELSQQLRGEIDTLKTNFKRYSETTLRAAESDANAQLTDLLAEVAREVGDIDARAETLARQEVTQAQADLGPLLADRPSPSLPAEPERKVDVTAPSGPAMPMPQDSSPLPNTSDSESQVKSDLAIWLAVNKLVLRSKGRGRDATAEFIEWRKRFRPEPSGSP